MHRHCLIFLILMNCLIVDQSVCNLAVRRLKDGACRSPLEVFVIRLSETSNYSVIVLDRLVMSICVRLGLDGSLLTHNVSLKLTGLLRMSMLVCSRGGC